MFQVRVDPGQIFSNMDAKWLKNIWKAAKRFQEVKLDKYAAILPLSQLGMTHKHYPLYLFHNVLDIVMLWKNICDFRTPLGLILSESWWTETK